MINYLTRREKLYLTHRGQVIVNVYRANDIMLAKVQEKAKDEVTSRALGDLRKKMKEKNLRALVAAYPKKDFSAFLNDSSYLRGVV